MVPPSKFEQVCEQRGPLLGGERSVDMKAVRRQKRWARRSRRGVGVHEIEECRVVIENFVERGRAVVVKIGCGLADSARRRDVERLPIVDGAAAEEDTGQERAPRIGARTAYLAPVGQ